MDTSTQFFFLQTLMIFWIAVFGPVAGLWLLRMTLFGSERI